MCRRSRCASMFALVAGGLLLLAGFDVRTAQEPAATKGPSAKIESLAWLAGGWRSESDDGASSSDEHWIAPAGGTMLGVNRAIGGGKTVFFEFLRIEERESTLVFLAQPKGRAPATAFALAEAGDCRVVFANPAHDFPQRIEYRREGETLHARVSGRRDGKEAVETWKWNRVGTSVGAPQ